MRFSKRFAWKLLTLLPIGLVGQVLPRTLGPGYIEIAARNQQGTLAVDLQVQQILANSKNTGWGGVMLIGGVTRVGKSTISAMLAEHLGAFVVPMDKVRRCYENLSKAEERANAKTRLLDQLCKHGSGLIIEGDELVRRSTKRQQLGSELMQNCSTLIQDQEANSQMGVELVWGLSERYGAIGIIIGASQDLPKDKAGAILSSGDERNCWAIKHLNEEEIQKLGRAIVLASEALSQEANKYGVCYFDVVSGGFATSVEAIVKSILELAATHSASNPNGSQVQPHKTVA